MTNRPPLIVGALVVVAALGVAWMMAMREGSRLAETFEGEQDGEVASTTQSDWSAVSLLSDAPLRYAFGGPATLASAPLPAGVPTPASATERPVATGEVLYFCADGHVGPVRLWVGERAISFAALPPCV